MTFQVYIDTAWVDLTSYLEQSSITISSRADDSFAVSTLSTLRTFTVPTTAQVVGSGYNGAYQMNIPPYTPCKIDDEYYWCKTTTKPLISTFGNGKVSIRDEFEILEANAILSCFIVGSKAFSITGTNTLDIDKVKILFQLMAQKYGYSLSVYDDTVFGSTAEEYSFKAGSTLYDCLIDICDHSGLKPSVRSWSENGNLITVDFVPRQVDVGLTYLLVERLEAKTVSQDVDTYCKYLETEASNVVDRTTLVHFKDLTCRAKDVLLNADEAIIELPCNVESIANMSIGTAGQIVAYIEESRVQNFTLGQTYTVGAVKNDIYFRPVYDSIQQITNNWLRDSDTFVMTSETSDAGNNYPSFIFTCSAVKARIETYIQEKSRFDLLPAQYQASLMVYQSGSNTIENLNSYYKGDIWNKILGNSRDSAMKAILTSGATSLAPNPSTIIGGGQFYYISGGYIQARIAQTTDYNPIHYKFDVDAYCITDPMLIDTKDDTPINELGYKPVGRSYDNGSNLIDFDRVIDGMHTKNETLGRVEYQVEVNTTGLSVPKARYSMVMNGQTYYISSVITTITGVKRLSVFNLVANYNKKADCIGVASQFTATYNPTNNIITRPILFEDGLSSSSFDESKAYYFKFKFLDHNDNNLCSKTIGSTNYQFLYKRASVAKVGNTVVLYCKAKDFYAFDVYRNPAATHTSNNYELDDAPYVDNSNEAEYVFCSIVTLPELSVDGSFLLPYTNASETVVKAFSGVYIYKDAREQLSFTVRLTLTN